MFTDIVYGGRKRAKGHGTRDTGKGGGPLLQCGSLQEGCEGAMGTVLGGL